MNKLQEHIDNDIILSQVLEIEFKKARRNLNPTADEILEDTPLERVVFK